MFSGASRIRHWFLLCFFLRKLLHGKRELGNCALKNKAHRKNMHSGPRTIVWCAVLILHNHAWWQWFKPASLVVVQHYSVWILMAFSYLALLFQSILSQLSLSKRVHISYTHSYEFWHIFFCSPYPVKQETNITIFAPNGEWNVNSPLFTCQFQRDLLKSWPKYWKRYKHTYVWISTKSNKGYYPSLFRG